MGEIKTQLAEEAEADRIQSTPSTTLPQDEGSSLMRTIGSFFVSSAHAQETKQDRRVVELPPGASSEIKLQMKAGAKVTYSWTATGGHLNFELHADGTDGSSTSYRKGRAQMGDEGELVAAFDGMHGWFWRNRSDGTVTLTINASGDFTEMQIIK